MVTTDTDFDIAIVGMAGRWPGARTLDEFWRHLADGVESIAPLSDDELRQAGVSDNRLQDPQYVKAAAALDDPGVFDAAFFGISPLEARTIDPQHRLLLELAHEALEHAACDPDRSPGRIGVFAGCAMNTYFTAAGLGERFSEQYIPTLIASDKDFLSTRLSYKLNLKGPSLTVQTACSTSLVAVHLARQSLLSGDTDVAIAGAASVRVPHRVGYLCDRGGVVSPDGHVRAFDAAANGTVFGSGAGVVVLKRFADATANGDTIHAVIKGSAVNNDGAAKAGYTAPSVDGQADVVLEAIANAGVAADSITFVEAHGSGTPVGDPIEVTALTRAFTASTDRRGYCAIGSVKSNIGHLDAAAGMAGLIKTVLALQHRQIPPTLHFTQANSSIDFAQTPFYVNAGLQEWVSDGPRRAGVMATGMGGTNAHVVLEEAPAGAIARRERTPQLLTLSAKTESALQQSTERLAAYLESDLQANLDDVAFTLQVGRKSLASRRFVVCSDTADAIAAIRETNGARVQTGAVNAVQRRPVIFLFPGIGDQYVGMAHGLYEAWPAFRHEVDRCADILMPHLGVDIRALIYPANGSWKKSGTPTGLDFKQLLGRQTIADDADTAALNATRIAQPALFTIEYAMARLWQSWGVTPDALCGHSMGEYVAACLAGVMSLEDALRMIAVRARLVSTLPPGGMLAVPMPAAELQSRLPSGLSIALINGPRLCVVAGPVDAIAAFDAQLTGSGVVTRRIPNGHAFHTPMLQPIAAALLAEANKVVLNEPTIPYISNVTGTWITVENATDPSYWVRHATQTARFDDAIGALWEQKDAVLVEVGPGRTLSVIATQHPDRRGAGNAQAVSSLRHHYEHESDERVLLDSVGKLWLAGLPIEWERMHPASKRRRLPLPTYPFEGRSHWLQREASRDRQPATTGIDRWFYAPTWERTGAPDAPVASSINNRSWLVIGEPVVNDSTIAAELVKRGAPVTVVRFGDAFERRADAAFVIDPGCAADYRTLLRQLTLPPSGLHIVHLGALTVGDALSATALDQKKSFNSLLHLAQAIGELGIVAPITIGVVTGQLHDVTGDEALQPGAATIAGICGAMPKEFPNVRCFNIDVVRGESGALPVSVVNSLLSEFPAPPQGPIAYRGRYRWERQFRNIRVPAASGEGELTRPLRMRGVYLITGGAGGVGLTIARYLATACQATLVLTKQTPLPVRSSWEAAITAADTSPSLRTMLAGLLELEASGATVEVVVADVANRQRMQEVRDHMVARYGVIHGVIHAAGTVRDGLMQSKTMETVAAVLAPKVQGTAALFDVFKNDALDFLVLFSSMTSVLAPYGVSEYSGANAFLDAFGSYANRHAAFRTVTINWPGWKDVGQLANLPIARALQGVKDALLERAIRPSDGVEAFRRVLQSDLTHVLVSPQDLDELIEESRAPFDATQLLGATKAIAATPAPERREGSVHGGLPITPTERALDEIWREVLGTDTSDIHASFFDLGGHSLLAITLVARIEERFGRRLPPATLLQASTIAQLAPLVDPQVTTPQAAIPAGSLVRIKGGTKPPFFCVHGIGGEVLPFKPLASSMAADQPFYGLQWDFDAAGPRFPSIETLATRYIAAIRRSVPNGPYLLGGYCSGAMIAWEMAQQLQAAGATVGLVVLIDHALPGGADRLTLSKFVSNLPYWITDDLMKSSATELKARARGKVNVALDIASNALRGTNSLRRRSDIRDALGMWNAPERQIDWIEGHYRQYLAYQPRPYSGAVTIVRARAMPLLSPHNAPEVGWGRLATAGARVHRIPGNHATMIQTPWVGELAAHLQADLDLACAQAASDRSPLEVAIAV